ncbi:MAG TPA: HK97 family phage prohead protease [Acidimicrobiales bacterium]|nr:HK97 family phage prohead protease [Acidimicrobiales bacterium]
MKLRDRSTFDVVRYAPAGAVRAAEDADTAGGPEGVLYGHFSVFNRWYEIDSAWEGNFLERVAPGAFRETFAEDVQRCWFEHGYSTVLDRMSLGAIEQLREDKTGAYYEVRLFDGLPQALVEGLRAGEYGASFRMRILAETVNAEPGTSEHNPKGLPEVTIQRVRCPEFGPVSIGASPHATANLRSGTDAFYDQLRSRDAELWAHAARAAGIDQTSTVGAGTEGAADGDHQHGPDRGRAAIARLIAAGIPLKENQ